MDQAKIGKLIAKLRKEKELTQQQLGDMVGVGHRAVSKWENGITLPDISIINDLSTILGITSDELLKGELNTHKETKAPKKNYKLFLLIISFIIIILAIIFIYKGNNKEYVYTLKSASNEYYVDGKAIYNGKNLLIYINKLEFQDYNFYQTKIRNYRYELILNDYIMFGSSYSDDTYIIKNESIETAIQKFNISFKDTPAVFDNEKLDNNDMYLKMIFIDENNNEIMKDIKLQIYEKEKDLQ